MRKQNNKIAPNPVDQATDVQEVKVPEGNTSTKQLDPRLMAGPLAERGCTDIICFLLFIGSVGLMAFISADAYKNGKPEYLVAAYDPDKKACGLDVVGYDYLYWAIPFQGYFNRTTCVSKCPTSNLTTPLPTELNCSKNKIVTSCQRNCMNPDDLKNAKLFPPDPNDATWQLNQFVCILNSTVAFNRICYPSQIIELLNTSATFSSAASFDQVTVWIEDLTTTRYMIIASFGIAFILGIIYMFLTRILAGILVWLSIALYFIGMGVLTYFCWEKQQNYHTIANDKTGNYTFQEQQKAGDNELTFKYIVQVLLGLIGLSFLGFACIFNKLRLAIAILKTAAIFVKDEFLIIFVPPIVSIFVFILWAYWVYTAVYIYSMAKIEGDGQTPFATVTMSELDKQRLWYFIFGGLWKNAFLQALNCFIIASTCCIWYFSQGSGQGAEKAIRTSIYRAFRYHLGSLAFGSLILAIVQFIRIILEYTRYQMEKMGASKNKVTKCLLKCLSCLMACFERFIRFLTRNAYIMIALTGKNFCLSAKEAFENIWANSMRFSLVNGIGAAFLLIGKAFITITTVFIFYIIITRVETYSLKLYSPILPCIIVFIIAYCISVLFMSIYSMACDTVLLCFIYDEDLNKQNGGQSAQHCPETLREFFETPAMAQAKEPAAPKSEA